MMGMLCSTNCKLQNHNNKQAKRRKTVKKKIEKRLGRVKGPIKSGPRTIDLDIIVFNNKIVHKDFDHDYVYTPIMQIVNSRGIQLENLPK